jgi:predicted DNA-binding transcriptional regulator AlpA
MITGANATPLPPPMLTTKEAAAYLKLSKSSLDKMRMHPGAGPIYVKMGPRRVAYRLADLDAWIAGNLRRSTSLEGV